jgi:hypothetical protein
MECVAPLCCSLVVLCCDVDGFGQLRQGLIRVAFLIERQLKHPGMIPMPQEPL